MATPRFNGNSCLSVGGNPSSEFAEYAPAQADLREWNQANPSLTKGQFEATFKEICERRNLTTHNNAFKAAWEELWEELHS
ncbi:MAG: hypothetical protein KBD15_00215 [Candidatus Magasanikbacteria bacterium]|jgi:hypothetical protein|nr:hypothetical protein [Candidatus Magasanikbacteria bacterium]